MKKLNQFSTEEGEAWFKKTFPKANFTKIFSNGKRKRIIYSCGERDHRDTESTFSKIYNNYLRNNDYKLPCKDCRDFHPNDVRLWFSTYFPNATIENIYTANKTEKSKKRLMVDYRCGNPNHRIMTENFSGLKYLFNKRHSLICADCQDFPSERIVRFIFNELFGVTFYKVRPSFLSLEKGNLELDGYTTYTKDGVNHTLAFEYQGEQHYEVRRRSKSQTQEHLEKELARIRKSDSTKKEICKDLGIKLYIIPFSKIKPIDNLKPFIKQLSIKLEVELPDDFDSKVIDLSKMPSTSGSQERINEIALSCESLNIKLLSKTWVNSCTKLEFECLNKNCSGINNGVPYAWKGSFSYLKEVKIGCPICRKNARQKVK